MAFHDVRLPTTFSEGSEFGPSFRTNIIELDNLAEHRTSRGPASGRRQYIINRGIATLDDLRTLYDFFIARQGALNSFRLKDWLDYATNSTGSTHRDDDPDVAHDDEDLVLVSGLTYQMVKRYTSGSQTVVRTLTKLVSGTVKVGDSSGNLTSGWTVDLLTGRVTFSSTPSGTPTGGCEFDVPVRFTEDTEAGLLVAINAMDVGALTDVRCIEDVDPVAASHDYPLGGATNHGAITADTPVSDLQGRLHIVAPTTTGRAIVLPPLTNLVPGGPFMCLVNDGTQTVDVDEDAADGGSTLTTIASGAAKQVWIGVTSGGAKEWHVF